MTQVVLLQLEDTLQQLMAPKQKGFMRKRHMIDHIWGGWRFCETHGDGGYLAIDFFKAMTRFPMTTCRHTPVFLGFAGAVSASHYVIGGVAQFFLCGVGLCIRCGVDAIVGSAARETPVPRLFYDVDQCDDIRLTAAMHGATGLFLCR